MSLEQEQIREMLEQAVYQQLFSTDKEDRIMGKNPEYTMQFTGVKELLDNFLDELNNNLDLVLDFKIGKFLEVFEKRFDIDLDGTEERIMTNFEGMGGKDIVMQNDTMLIYMVLTKMVEAIREKAYAKWGKRRIIEQYEEITGKKFNENINEEVNKLA